MEQLVEFNGVRLLLTTAKVPAEVHFDDAADVVLSVHPGEMRLLKGRITFAAEWWRDVPPSQLEPPPEGGGGGWGRGGGSRGIR